MYLWFYIFISQCCLIILFFSFVLLSIHLIIYLVCEWCTENWLVYRDTGCWPSDLSCWPQHACEPPWATVSLPSNTSHLFSFSSFIMVPKTYLLIIYFIYSFLFFPSIELGKPLWYFLTFWSRCAVGAQRVLCVEYARPRRSSFLTTYELLKLTYI